MVIRNIFNCYSKFVFKVVCYCYYFLNMKVLVFERRSFKDFIKESLKYTAFGKIAEILTEIFIKVFILQFSDYASLKLNYLIDLANYFTKKIETI